ncbi:hypothetical protein FB45DRAFT_924151 [Roridomyces roridus]|uniref:Secreted protein n=1 Tax=Roridomyces roridus TaxID=1738132 RepID=A0AAD7BLY1_9AGAR|nr:hypothetical protein FB45DRAFT_924151 [Roridomyces roridus]
MAPSVVGVIWIWTAFAKPSPLCSRTLHTLTPRIRQVWHHGNPATWHRRPRHHLPPHHTTPESLHAQPRSESAPHCRPLSLRPTLPFVPVFNARCIFKYQAACSGLAFNVVNRRERGTPHSRLISPLPTYHRRRRRRTGMSPCFQPTPSHAIFENPA